MNRDGRRCTLREPFCNKFGYEYRAGQCGTILWWSDGATAIVELDGYEHEREAHRLQKEKDGEGFNVHSWITEVPIGLLEIKSAEGEK